MSSEPIAWRVSSVRNYDAADLLPKRPVHEEYRTREEAEARKRLAQAEGYVSTVTPVYLSQRAVAKRLRAAQLSWT